MKLIKRTCLATVALLAIAIGSAAWATEAKPGCVGETAATGDLALTAKPVQLAQSQTVCQQACAQQYNTCQNAGRNNCYTVLQRCWDTCAGR